MKFTKDDFGGDYGNKYISRLDAIGCAEIANAKLKEWLDAAPTVYLEKHDNLSHVNEIGFIKKGKIVCIEEIKKECEKHIPTIKSKQVSLPQASDPYAAALVLGCEVVCLNCGKSLVAEWKVK